jgi:hypothetical protein
MEKSDILKDKDGGLGCQDLVASFSIMVSLSAIPLLQRCDNAVDEMSLEFSVLDRFVGRSPA